MSGPKDKSVLVRPAVANEMPWINARYADIDFLLSSSSDLIALAEVDGIIAGMGRVVSVWDNVGELGGMVVFDEFQGLGLARKIIAALVAWSDRERLYCLPFARLKALYESMGFTICDDDIAVPVPVSVAEKHRWCNSHYDEPVLLMRLDLLKSD